MLKFISAALSTSRNDLISYVFPQLNTHPPTRNNRATGVTISLFSRHVTFKDIYVMCNLRYFFSK